MKCFAIYVYPQNTYKYVLVFIVLFFFLSFHIPFNYNGITLTHSLWWFFGCCCCYCAFCRWCCTTRCLMMSINLERNIFYVTHKKGHKKNILEYEEEQKIWNFECLDNLDLIRCWKICSHIYIENQNFTFIYIIYIIYFSVLPFNIDLNWQDICVQKSHPNSLAY